MNAAELSPEDLRWSCDVSVLPEECTGDMIPIADFIGQDRASRAIEFGLGVDKQGFNIFVTGLAGTGKTDVIEEFLQKVIEERAASEQTVPSDWCYVHNFTDPDRPLAIGLRKGLGRTLQADMEGLIDQLREEVKRTFESEEFARQRQAMLESTQKHHQEIMDAVVEEARKGGFALRFTPAGMVLIPLGKDGKPMQEDEYLKLPEQEKKSIEEKQVELSQRVEKALREGKRLEGEIADKLTVLDKQAGDFLVERPLKRLKEKYRDYPKMLKYLDAVKEHILANLDPFKAGPGSTAKTPLPFLPGPAAGEGPTDPFLFYKVNVFVDNSEVQGPPIVIETNPTYHNLFGMVEKRSVFGSLVTDFMHIKSGSLSRANGGYLVLYDRDVLSNLGVWEGLKRVIKDRELRIEEPASFFGWLPPQGLRPEPIATHVKVIILGDPLIYYYLSMLDVDFRETFKVKAEFNRQIEKSAEHVVSYACFISACCEREGLRPFDRTGVKGIVEYGARLVEDQEKLSSHFSDIQDLLVEANYWAGKDGGAVVTGEHVETALREKTLRVNLVEERIRELIVENTLMVDVEGEVVGQVNGLAIHQLGDFSFGRPSRITAKTFMGRGGVINIERESDLSGKTHDKGVLILSGYLGARYAQERPLSLNISLCFEQSYEGIDGDSASSTELYALLSSLAEVPLKQGIAVTGSVNQNGEVQAIGGVNRKIEGFFDVCRIKGLSGEQGVVIPHANVRNLMLRPDVVKAVEDALFHIYAVRTIDEGIEVLTGVPAGQKDGQGAFPEGSINLKVQERLNDLSERMRQLSPFARGDETKDEKVL